MYHLEHLHDCVHHKTSETSFITREAARDALSHIFSRCYGIYPIVARSQDSFTFKSKNILHTLQVVEN